MERELNVIVPINIGQAKGSMNADKIVKNILNLTKSGFNRFVLVAPSIGYRYVGFYSEQDIIDCANIYKEVASKLKPYNVTLGWWVAITLKSGLRKDFQPMVRFDGSLSPFANCPLDENFSNTFSKMVALFAKIAKPSFIITEDDFSIIAGTMAKGCFCDKHIAEFNKRQGTSFTRESLVKALENHDKEGLKLNKAWRDLMKDSVVNLAKKIRAEVDKESPEIPIGIDEPGGADLDGNMTLEFMKAMAGKRHKPFARFFGAGYNGATTKDIGVMLFNPLYKKQSIKEDVTFLHESDPYPQLRYFSTGNFMRTAMSTVYSYGYVGSIFQAINQFDIDNPEIETCYTKMYREEKERFYEISSLANRCDVRGVEVCYDPFYNTIDQNVGYYPYWVNVMSRFGIPYTSTKENVAMLDLRQAKYFTDKEIKEYLSKGLFLDGTAAKILCERGYSKYLGVDVGESVDTGMFAFDFSAKEYVLNPQKFNCPCGAMTSSHQHVASKYSQLLKLTPNNKDTEVITETRDFNNTVISPAMTRFVNKLGGRIVVLGVTIMGNQHQNLFNYIRQSLIQSLITWCGGDIPQVINEPEIYFVYNKAKEGENFKAMFTISNLCEDNLNSITVKMSSDLINAKSYLMLNEKAKWVKVKTKKCNDKITFITPFNYLHPVILKII